MITRDVTKIIADVKLRGDTAVLMYNRVFDKNTARRFELSPQDIALTYAYVDKQILLAIKKAIKNISLFSKRQLKQLVDFNFKTDYGMIRQAVLPISSVGCYVPGGRFPLLSSAIMSVVPAKIAGVKNIVVCSPNIKPEVVVAANLAGATRIFNLGGVQAIAALAYGTKQVPKVDKIVGPGNKYVTEAKRQVFGDVSIDMIAGPSELLIIADESAARKYIEADLAAQKEHDPDAIAKVLYVRSSSSKEKDKAISLANNMAPEHLSIMVKDPTYYTNRLVNYGSLFVGKMSAVAFGDYCSGTNHILPTSGAARYRGGLSVLDFVKVVTSQKITVRGASNLSSIAATLAKAEGLRYHQLSSELRTS